MIWAGRSHIVFRRGVTLYAQMIGYDPLRLQGEPVAVAGDSRQSPVPFAAIAGASVSDVSALVYQTNAPISKQFRWVSRDGRTRAAVARAGDYETFDLSRDGFTLAVSTQESTAQNLWVFDTVKGTETRLTLGLFSDVDPRFSPDARSVIFGSSRDRARSPFRATFAGDAPSLVFSFTGRLFALDDWSTDGRWLI